MDSVLHLLDSIDWAHCNLDKHREACTMILEIVNQHSVDSLDGQLVDRALEYLGKIFCTCEDSATVYSAIEAIAKMPLSKLETFVLKWMTPLESQLDSAEQCTEWFKHQNMGGVIHAVLNAHRDSLNQTLLDRMFEYCTKLIHKCENGLLIGYAICAFGEFPLHKLEASMPQLVEPLESDLGAAQLSTWYRHRNATWVIGNVLRAQRDSLNEHAIDCLFDYLAKIIHNCEKEDLTDAPETFALFSGRKLDFALPQLMNSMELDLMNMDQCKWFKHQNMAKVIGHVLDEHRDSLDEQIIEQMFDHCTKVIDHCENAKLISYTFAAFGKFSQSKLESSLPQMIAVLECELRSKKSPKSWYKHQNMSLVIDAVLKRDALDKSLIKQMYAYLLAFVQQCSDSDVTSIAREIVELIQLVESEVNHLLNQY